MFLWELQGFIKLTFGFLISGIYFSLAKYIKKKLYFSFLMVSVAVLGSGGREHALGYNLALDSDVSDVFYLPGNAGTAREFKGQNVLRLFIESVVFFC